MEFGDRLGIAGLVLALVALGVTIMWPTKRSIAYVAFVIAGLLMGLWGIGEYRAKHEKSKQRETSSNVPEADPPHFRIEHVNLQYINNKLERPIKFIVYLKSDGGEGAIEASYTVTTLDHVPRPETQEELENGLFANLRLVQSLYPTAIDIHHQDNVSFFIQADKATPAQERKVLADFNNGGPLYLMAVFRYVGHPDLKPVEVCEYWTKKSYYKPASCKSHNTP